MLAEEIARELGETKPGPRRLIADIITVMGSEAVQALLEETRQIEASGGLMVKNGSRRRTMGGVFFFLARQRMDPEQRQRLFPPARRQPEVHPLRWSERESVIQQLDRVGEVTDVRVKLMGYPGDIQRKGQTVVTQMVHLGGGGTLPRGLPEMPSEPTVYTVYMAAKQWQQVESALRRSDRWLVIDGQSAYDPVIPGIAVFATQVATQRPSSVPERLAVGQGVIAADVRQELRELYIAVERYRTQIASLEQRPPDDRFGLKMTRTLLERAEARIAALED